MYVWSSWGNGLRCFLYLSEEQRSQRPWWDGGLKLHKCGARARFQEPHTPPPPKAPICKLFAVLCTCTLFAAFESHNFVTGPCLAVYFSHINLNLAESSTYYPKPAYVLPIPYLTHGLPLIVCRYLCHMFATYRLHTQRAHMDTYIILYYMLACSMHLQRHVYT